MLRSGAVALALVCGLSWTQAALAGQLKDGISAIDHQDFGRARGVLEAYSKRFPSDPRPYYYLAKVYENSFEVSRVDDTLQTYRRLSDKRTKILQTLEGAEPVPVYRAMLADDPTDLSARLLLIVSLIQSNAHMIALAELQALPRESVPNELQDVLHAMWGSVYLAQNNYAQARAEFKECWRLNVNNPLPGTKLAQIDKLEKAQQAAQQNAIFEQDTPQARSFELTFKLGKDLIDEGNYDGAIEALNQALASQPDNADAKQLLAVAQRKGADLNYQHGIQFMKDQKYGAAYDCFQAALKLDPNFTKAQIASDDAKAKADAQERAAGGQGGAQ